MVDAADFAEDLEVINNDRSLPALGPRRLRIFFYTTNINKFLQARHIFSRHGYILEHFSNHSQPYSEDYANGKDALLARAILEVRQLVGRSYLFFVEDTSLRIDALSTAYRDFPGLQVKEWFASTSFSDLDGQLRAENHSRSATIKSGIALHIPGRAAPVFFRGETSGHVAAVAQDFPSSPIHPWLSASSFDGWFIPDGSDKRLGEMTPDESMRLHFRARSLRAMIERLDEYSAILNLPQNSVYVRRSTASVAQIQLFPEAVQRWVIVGPRAAGKTTFGEYATAFSGAPHFEGSTIVRAFWRDFGSGDTDLSVFATALHAQFGDDVVIRTLVERVGLLDSASSVLTGVRKFAELKYLEDCGIRYQLVYVDATDRTRYDRYVQRARDDRVLEFEEFCAKDSDDECFLRFAKGHADIIIQNKFSLNHYLSQIRFVLTSGQGRVPQGLSVRKLTKRSLLLQIVEILSESGPLTSTSLLRRVRADIPGIHLATVTRTLRSEPKLFQQVVSASREVAFKLSPIGEIYLRLAQVRGPTKSQPST